MRTDLAYIDKSVDAAVAERASASASLSEKVRSDIKRKAVQSIAGFEVFDEDVERKLLDDQIRQQRANVKRFIQDRSGLRDRLAAASIVPLAFVPSAAWDRICLRAGLFTFRPDSSGKVRFHHNAFNGLNAAGKWSEDEAVILAKQDWSKWLVRMFPGRTDKENAGAQVTLVLPRPPGDVVDVLLKANRAGLAMWTAAVAEAISFKETIPEMRKGEIARREEEARRLEALRADPIVYTEHGSAVAVLAQFGDFPIEQEVVDAVVAADDFIPEMPTEAQWVGLTTGVATNTGSLGMQGLLGQADLRQLYYAQAAALSGRRGEMLFWPGDGELR